MRVLSDLQGERDHLIEQRQIFHGVAIRGLVEGRFRLRLVRPALAQFEALLHIAHGGQVFVELVLVLLVHLLGKAVRLVQHGIEDGGLHLVFLHATRLTLRRVGDEEFLEQLRRIRHRRHTHARLRPRDLAAAMDAAFRTDRKRRETASQSPPRPRGTGRWSHCHPADFAPRSSARRRGTNAPRSGRPLTPWSRPRRTVILSRMSHTGSSSAVFS
jgi:hypothetical protein